MKKNVPRIGFIQPSLLKLLRIMKLFIILMFFAVFQVSAKDAKGQNITLQLRQTEIRKVLTAVEKQSNIRFLYNYELKELKTKVDFTASDLTLAQALDKLFWNSGLTYKKVNDNLIAVLSDDPKENNAIRITGKISGENSEPLNGVSVTEKGTSNGTVTNSDGVFALTVG